MPQDVDGLLDLRRWLAEAAAEQATVYACGPGQLLDAIESRCASWQSSRLRTERFVPKEQGAPVRGTAFDVELARSGMTVSVDPGVSVLDAVRSAGVAVLSSCHAGTCGTCETAVLAGAPDHRDSILTDTERAAQTCMFICVSRACSDRLILDL